MGSATSLNLPARARALTPFYTKAGQAMITTHAGNSILMQVKERGEELTYEVRKTESQLALNVATPLRQQMNLTVGLETLTFVTNRNNLPLR